MHMVQCEVGIVEDTSASSEASVETYTIREFWTPRLERVTKEATTSFVQGWSFQDEGLNTFEEAPLTLSTEFGGDNDPTKSSILLVSAPGAVGKSTLARQIAYETDSIYIDLADADPVGANTLTGGLARSQLYNSWQAQSVAVLIDGLDEARLKVTQEAFQAFLSDVAELSANRAVPTVLFGRTGAVQDAWLLLADGEADVAVLEIGYYGPEESVNVAEKSLRELKPSTNFAQVERNALRELLKNLRNQTASDGNRFAGYAPVLQAVARYVADETNPGALVAQLSSGAQPVTLQTVVADILERERSKLRSLEFDDPQLMDRLYSPDEQLDILVAHLYNLPRPQIPDMGPSDAQRYSAALDTWVSDHPFLGKTLGSTSSAVFDATISARALGSASTSASEASLQKELSKGAAANPFLFEFYLGDRLDSSG